MKTDTRSTLLLCCGILLVALGAMPLNGYLGFLVWPFEFHRDAYIGSALHLLSGLIPWLAGVTLLAIGSNKRRHLVAGSILGMGGGVLLGLGVLLMLLNNAKDHLGALTWIAIFVFGLFLATTVRATLNLSRKTSHHTH